MVRITQKQDIDEILKIPDLMDIQKKSYNEFLMIDVPPDKRKRQGLQEIFESIFPIYDYNGFYELQFVGYEFSFPKHNVDECIERGETYSAALKGIFRLIIKEKNEKTGEVSIKEAQEQAVQLCDLPLMTDRGTFVINGAERVIVSQLHRSPGASFEEEEETEDVFLKPVYTGRIVPYRGTWLEFEFDLNEIAYVKLDRKKKFPLTMFLRALGYSSNEEILKIFFKTESKSVEDKEIVKKVLARDVIDKNGEIIAEAGSLLTKETVEKIKKADINKIETLILEEDNPYNPVLKSFIKDNTRSEQEALNDIFRKMRPGEPVTATSTKNYFKTLFFDNKRYNLGVVGRYKLNKILNFDDEKNTGITLRKEDIIGVIKKFFEVNAGLCEKTDIDHLGNRRVRSVGELVENQFRVGLLRVEKMIRERMTIIDMKNAIPANLINPKPLVAAIREFFGTSQLSQFMDQVNPLAELTHKRRISALGPGGLNRERAGFEVRDVHYTHYGRLCPIETPEGQNIGLITSLATYARVNEYGFIETPYRKVKNGKITNEIEYLTADREDEFKIGQSNINVDENNKIIDEVTLVRYKGDVVLVNSGEVQYVDVSPKQVISVAASLIPFLEHDDANRALMGSNMQRQAVPLLKTEAPYVGTGMEAKAAYDSGRAVIAKSSGRVAYVDSSIIIITKENKANENLKDSVDVYHLKKFKRTNQDTTINEKPLVKKGDYIKKGDVIADGLSMDKGELALGKNVFVAFMSWHGYNYEDAIVISEDLLKNDTFTSVHIEEYEIEARETKLGPEEITRDIPNVSEDTLKNLDFDGIIRIGAKVKPGDILVGKVTPISSSNLTPEEKLLKAIFGSKADNVKDTSLRVPPGIEGVVVDIKIFSRKEHVRRKDKENEKTLQMKKEREKILQQMSLMHKETIAEIEGRDISKEEKEKLKEYENVYFEFKKSRIEQEFKDKRQIKGDELAPGVIKLIKVLIAKKRKVSVGDKLSGRHGNKGVISRILPVEEMPYLPDGTPVQVVLNPLGVPSRMNVGQLLETQLGWVAKIAGQKFETPVFNGMKEEEIKELLKEVNFSEDGKTILYDGRTGEPFAQRVTVGTMYMMKLIHMVDDKIHARSIGPYSLITQQPLGGKAQFGGQRFGEMEVWALEAYGAAYTLQEMLTAKSDDVEGRKKLYEAIVRGKNIQEPGIPESFNVLVKELQGLGLNVELIKKKSKKE
ncbi:MAG: DNA-directed RNA polymerase subunit beta [Candidatus Goldbacteria bacterium]|nr:DNA-directed RNA polymerase subunit beta [Candidatus Goldiibacteriota bacterium]